MTTLAEAVDALLDKVRDRFTTDDAGRAAILTALGAADFTLLAGVLQRLNAPHSVGWEFVRIHFQHEAPNVRFRILRLHPLHRPHILPHLVGVVLHRLVLGGGFVLCPSSSPTPHARHTSILLCSAPPSGAFFKPSPPPVPNFLPDSQQASYGVFTTAGSGDKFLPVAPSPASAQGHEDSDTDEE
ncbi:hypothetical protein B0H19DRAFT_1231466 [Mycena capillaripes]|nr:hypothetical protein B0H19DRAFT_1231466 [Mycena capillaripes]